MKRTEKSLVEKIKDSAKISVSFQTEMFKPAIPTGSTLLNLACSDHAELGYGEGKVVNLIGDSSSGKTLLCLTLIAEALKMDRFKDYKFIYDDVERACEFDVGRLFGKEAAERIQSPAGVFDQDDPYSDTIQDFYSNIDTAFASGKPFVYILDSFDALTSEQELKKSKELLEAHRKGKESIGSYGMDKAKVISEILRSIVKKLKSTNSLLIVVSQTRDNINPMSFVQKTRSGGNALRFYSSHEVWLAVGSKIKSKDRIVGANIRAKVTKNKLTGKVREVEFPIYYSYGVDDIGSMIDFLLKEGHWKKQKNTITPEGLAIGTGTQATREKLIQIIEQENLEAQLKQITRTVWMKTEEDLKLKRKKKF